MTYYDDIVFTFLMEDLYDKKIFLSELAILYILKLQYEIEHSVNP